MRIKRRTFIIVIAALILAISSRWILRFFRNLFINPIGKPELLSLIINDNAIQAIGQKYRSQFPEESSEGQIIKKLEESGVTNMSTTSTFETRIKEDFKTGKVQVVDGWVLSVTEARQCALFSILY